MRENTAALQLAKVRTKQTKETQRPQALLVKIVGLHFI